jgi:hypothetical protein
MLFYQYCDAKPPVGWWLTQADTVITLNAYVSLSCVCEGNSSRFDLFCVHRYLESVLGRIGRRALVC